MGNTTTKQIGKIDAENVLRKAYNIEDASMTVNGFLIGKVGHRVTLTISTTNVANDTEAYSFYDASVSPPTLLYTFTIVYTDATREQMISAERTA